VAVLLDAGALIAFERSNPTVLALLHQAQARSILVRTTSGVTAQVWRDRSRQVRLGLLLRGVDEVAIEPASSPRVGAILAASRTSDIVDASLIEIAADGDEVITSDPDDLVHLARSIGKRISIIPIST
jgi:hypothetical protein